MRRSRVRIPGATRKKQVVGLERGPLSLVSTTEELLGSNSSGFGLESREYSLVVRVPRYRSRGVSSIPGATRFSEK
jgi:hypothetical protein